MKLEKTTILPADDPQLSVKMFRHLIDEEPLVLLVVFGKGPEPEAFVQRADRLAGGEGEPRRVVWAREPEHVRPVLSTLKGDSTQLNQLQSLKIRGFALSFSDTIRDVIAAEEPVPDMTRILLAYANAESEAV